MTTKGASDLLAPEGANGKKEPSQVSIPFHFPQQIDEVLESTDSIVDSETEASEMIYRVNTFSISHKATMH